MSQRIACGWGLARTDPRGQVLDCWFPQPRLGDQPGDQPAGLEAGRDPGREVDEAPRRVVIDLDAPPRDAADAYLRLHLLSHRLVRPRGLNLDGLFGVLANVVWTSVGPCAVEGFERVRLQLRRQLGPVTVLSVD
ncbi:MAG: 2,3,4,5-tetrahydropyridine-2,6-dicarboxylate N-succinyltransferase, partial [Propionibacteriaceae bacterium]|nr:2,3,4,5-tetrahydropyridine-2,6-dicarboxylate N-succinyltransferase [Propionibacteriaceae bacterium]